MPALSTQTVGLVDTWGGKFQNEIDMKGPTSYVPGTGDLLSSKDFGCPNNLLFAIGSVSVSGTYFTICRPAATGGYTTWYVMWFVSSTGAEAGAIDLSAERVKVMGMGV